MVEERPKRRRKKVKARAKKAQPKKAQPKKAQPKKAQPVLEEEQLPGLLEGEVPRGVPVTEGEAVGEEQPRVVAEEEAAAEEWPAVVAEREAAEEERPTAVAEKEAVEEERPPVVAEKEAVSAGVVKVAVPAREPEPIKGSEKRSTLTEKLMDVPEFRQRVVKLVVQKFS